jgi:hypothetical protein
VSHLFCFGLGYSAGYLAERLTPRGWTVSGTATTEAGAAALSARGFRGYAFDGGGANLSVGAALRDATHVLLSIPPGSKGDPALRSYEDDLAASASLSWIGYFSTVGVYGDTQGGWVDEETAPRPGSPRGQRRLDAENAWLAFGKRTGKRVMIFRLPGIYGPGRSTLNDLRAGTARRLIKPGQVFNRIHVADIAAAVEAALDKPFASRVYNLTDDDPAPPQDVVAYGAELLGLPPLPDIDFATATLSPMGQSFYSESKRVSNARMKAELGVALAYPSYRDGLKAIAASE